MAHLVSSKATFTWVTEQYVQLRPYQSRMLAHLMIGSEIPTNYDKMKYYSSTLLYGASEILGSKPIITELCIPLLSSRDDDIKKFAEKKQFTVEYQTLLGVVPPSIRTLRKVHTPMCPLDPLVLDDQMKGYVKSLKALNIHPARIYTAVIVEDATQILQALRDAILYLVGLHSVEIILSIPASNFKEVVAMNISKCLTEYASEFVYKDKSDPEGIYKVNIKTNVNAYSMETSLTRVRDVLHRIRADRILSTCIYQQRLEILNTSLP